MKEVTRVHIAKTAYDIEIDAKKDLEKYINSLELYTADAEIVEDIEIRITELLAGRGIEAGGVITTADVASLRVQLGEPKDFAEDDESVEVVAEMTEPGRRRLYRDKESAVLGGVMSGIAKYFDVNPLWPRLAAILVFFVSFGTASVVYLVLWLAVPQARTTAEKLELEGKPVTLESIRARAELADQVQQNTTPGNLKKVLLFLAGLASAMVALGAVITTAVVVFGLYIPREGQLAHYLMDEHAWIGQMAMVAFVLSGLMLAALGVLMSYAAFSKQFNKKLGIATLVIVAIGILSFGGGVATVITGVEYERQNLEQAIEEREVELDNNFAQVKQLVASAHAVRSGSYGASEMTIEYVVDSGQPRYILNALPGVSVDVNVQGEQARVSLKSSGEQNYALGRVSLPRLIIYGPELDSVEIHQGEFQYTAERGATQPLVVSALDTTRFRAYGNYSRVEIGGGGTISLDSSTVSELLVEQQGYSSVSAGVVRTLSVIQPDVCPAEYDSPSSRVAVRGVSGGEFTYNGQSRDVQTVVGDCGMVAIGYDTIDSI